MRRPSGLTVAIVVVAAVLVIAIAGPYAGSLVGSLAGLFSPRTLTIEGTVALFAVELLTYQGIDGMACSGTRHLQDISIGAPITVADATGRVVGIGRLGGGKPGQTEGRCDFAFKIDNVAESDFYGIQVARREVSRFPKAEASRVYISFGPR